MPNAWEMVGAAVVLVAVIAVTASAVVVEEVSCQEAVTMLMPCMEFLKGQGPPTPTAPCCMAVRSLNGQCGQRPDRVKVCQCLKDAAPGFGVDPDRAKSLPALCNVQLPFPIIHQID